MAPFIFPFYQHLYNSMSQCQDAGTQYQTQQPDTRGTFRHMDNPEINSHKQRVVDKAAF
jgi:hypothetical protein